MNTLLLAILLLLVGGFAALWVTRVPRLATVVGAGAASLGCLLGLAPTLTILTGAPAEALRVDWDVAHGAFSVGLDPLSAFFLLPLLILGVPAAIFGGAYLFAYRHEKRLGGPWLFFNLFLAAMILVLIARTALLFLVAWELMSLSAFCLVTFEHEKAEVRQAGWIYLIATHVGVLSLLCAFLLLGRRAGGLEFSAFHSLAAQEAGWAGLIFLLALIGFGAKAGLVPFHVWLPEAHPAAPSHVSALMSGVMIKMGLYGILRTLTFLGPPALWWGELLAGAGLLTALVGISLGLYQRDLKRVLAYSSIENLGLMVLALGVGLWGASTGRPTVAALGLTGSLLHVWNHAFMKGLMFLSAGSLVQGAGTRDLERMGGLLKRMPWTGFAMLVGAVALAALPPLNGFVGKWLIYMSLMKGSLASGAGGGLVALFALSLLALIGGLSVITFVRLVGVALLGSPRGAGAEAARESSPWMSGPLQLLVLLCLLLAVVPQVAVGLLPGVRAQVLGPAAPGLGSRLDSLEAPLASLGALNAWTLALGLALAAWLWAVRRQAPGARAATWGCGYAMPTARMQYTGRSFSEMLAEGLLPPFLRPRLLQERPQGIFPPAGRIEAQTPDPLAERVYLPFFRACAERFSRLRFLQQGRVHIYLVYIMFMVALALAWVPLRSWLWGTLP